MFNQIERELKVLLTKEQYDAILHSYDWDEIVTQKNVYYDDEQASIRKFGAMRIRRIGDTRIFTLKIRRDPITQTELEKEIDVDAVDQITDPEILQWMEENHVPKKVSPFAQTVTVRHICKMEKGELCLDQTDFGKVIDYELEYEYTRDHDGIQVLNRILAPIGLKYEKNCPSKLARAVQYAS